MSDEENGLKSTAPKRGFKDESSDQATAPKRGFKDESSDLSGAPKRGFKDESSEQSTAPKRGMKDDSSDDEHGHEHGSEGSNAAGDHVRNIVHTYSQIAQSKELQKLRQQDRGLFDTLLQHAVPFALNAAQAAVKALASGSGKRDVGSEIAVRQHLPTAINFAHQVMAIPEVQGDRGIFDKIFSIGMPLVLSTAQSLLGAKRGLADSSEDDEAQRGLFSSIIGTLPGAVFNVLSDVIGGKRGLEGEDRGFFDILKKVAPIVLNVASTAVNSLVGQRSLSFAPTDRGFFDSLKNIVGKVVNNPTVQKIGSAALNMGIQVATSALQGQRGVGDIAPVREYTEAHVRGFFGSLLQTLTPIAMGALQGAVGAIGGKRDIALPQERGIFDIIAQALPAVIQVAQQAFSQKRGLAAPNEDEAEYLQRVLANASGPLIAAARAQVANRNTDRGILGSIIGTLLPF